VGHKRTCARTCTVMRPNGQEVQDWRTSQEFRLKEMLLPKVATAPRKVGQVVSHCEVAAETAALAVLSMKEVVHDNDQEHMDAMKMVLLRCPYPLRWLFRGASTTSSLHSPKVQLCIVPGAAGVAWWLFWGASTPLNCSRVSPHSVRAYN